MKKILIIDDVEGWRKFNSEVVNAIFNNDVQIEYASCAAEAYNQILENNNNPYEIILTDLQMEDDYAPKYAGEWLVEQIKALPNYYKTKIIMVSATYNIKNIADSLNVNYIQKSLALKSITKYEELLS